MEDSSSAENYEAFKERVNRTVYVDNLSPQVTEAILKAAFDQFFGVANIQFIPNYFGPDALPRAALVELKTEQAAEGLVRGLSKSPFMVCGMPRPVRARAAAEEMFEDRPRKPGRKITVQWVDKKDPNFEVCRKMKNMTKRHAAEARALLQRQLEQEEKLGNQQDRALKTIYKKYDTIDGVQSDGTAKHLAGRYNLPKHAG